MAPILTQAGQDMTKNVAFSNGSINVWYNNASVVIPEENASINCLPTL